MKKERVNELISSAYQMAKEHGFNNGESIKTLRMGIICEIAEAVEADRRDAHADVENFKKKCSNYGSEGKPYNVAYRLYIKGSVEEELADICIRLFDLAGQDGITAGYDITGITYNTYNVHNAGAGFPEKALKAVELITSPYKIKSPFVSTLSFMLGWSADMGIDLEWHIDHKMKYNKSRNYKHGKKY